MHFASDSDGIPKDEVVVCYAPQGQLVRVPFPDGTFKLVANVSEAPEQPDVGFMQGRVDSRGPQSAAAREFAISCGLPGFAYTMVWRTDSERAGSPSRAMPRTTTVHWAGRA